MTITQNHVFPAFSKRHPSFERFGEIDSECIQLFRDKTAPHLLPDLLIDFWNEYGEGRFSSGLLYICNPTRKKLILEFFFPGKIVYPLIISSFGSTIFTDLEKIFYISPIYGWYRQDALNFELLFEILLKREDYLEGAFDLDFHKECIQKLGLLERDKIFGFEPAIALGGNDENLDSVKKFQIDAYLAFLSQLVELEER